MDSPDSLRPWLGLAPLALALVILVAACGGGSSKPAAAASTTTTTTGGGRGVNAAAVQAFRSCMQQHGVTIPTAPPRTANSTPPSTDTASTDAGSGGPRVRGGGFGGGFGGLGTVIASADPATKAAFQACQGQLPAGFLQRIQQGQTQLQAYVSCMQSHGVTVSGLGRGFGSRSTTTTTPQFAAANSICKALLPARGQGGPGGAGGPGGPGGPAGPGG
jgi:hypothetical protein